MEWPISWNDVKNAMPIVFRAEDSLYPSSSEVYVVDKNLCDYISAGGLPVMQISEGTDIYHLSEIRRNNIGANNHYLEFNTLALGNSQKTKLLYLFNNEEDAFAYSDR